MQLEEQYELFKIEKNNYLAIIPFIGEKKMVEIKAKNEEEAYKLATKYATKYCKTHGCMYINPVIIKIPDRITIIE